MLYISNLCHVCFTFNVAHSGKLLEVEVWSFNFDKINFGDLNSFDFFPKYIIIIYSHILISNTFVVYNVVCINVMFN